MDQAEALPVDGLMRALATYHHFGENAVISAGEELAAAHERMIETLRDVLHGEEKKFREED